jgi:hypothetical protein
MNTAMKAFFRLGIRGGVHALFGRRKTLVVFGGAISIGSIVALLMELPHFSKATADDTAVDPELNAALQGALNAVLASVDCPKDPEAISVAAADVLPFLYPDVANREMRKDPGFAAAQDARIAVFLNPELVRADLQKDPLFAKQEEERARRMAAGANEAVRQRQRENAAATILHWNATHSGK